MPTPLREHQHEVFSLVDPTLSCVFGTEDTGLQTATVPTISGGDVREQDSPNPNADGARFGVDRLGPKAITFEMSAFAPRDSVTPQADVEDTVDDFEALWTDPLFRSHPTFVAVLRSMMAGRTRRCYGRPRRYADTPTALLHQGYIPVTCDFQLGDDRWYDDEESEATARPLPVDDGGLVEPIVEPVSTYEAATGDAVITIGGRKSTWPVVHFVGPSTNPKVEFTQVGREGRVGRTVLTIALVGTIPSGVHYVFDPRPWVNTVTRDYDGADVGGLIDASVTPPLSECLLRKGDYGVTYTTLDTSGTSSAQVRWRNAYSRP